MAIVQVALGARSYDIPIEQGALDRAGDLLSPYARNGRLVVVTDAHVAAAQLPRLDASLRAAGIMAEPIILPPGEQTKSWRHLEQLLDALLALEIERGDHVVALGGGVIGDLVGFAASILKRGCHFIQVPTTLLAQVDSSVGGKTAINTQAGVQPGQLRRRDMRVGDDHQPPVAGIGAEERARAIERALFDRDIVTARAQRDLHYCHAVNCSMMRSTVTSCGAATLLTWMGASA